jgi:transcriptional regulator with XRE-family HTH domain
MSEIEGKNLGQRLREIREAQHLSTRELSRLSGVTKDTISATERGQRRIRHTTLEKLATGLGVDIADLTGWDPKGIGAQLAKQHEQVSSYLRAKGYGLTAMANQEFAALLDSSSPDELVILRDRIGNEREALEREYALVGESDFKPKWAHARSGERVLQLKLHMADMEHRAAQDAPAEMAG